MGQWIGYQYYGLSMSESDGMDVEFPVDKVYVDGSLEGRGSNSGGYYSISGTFRDSHISFTREYLHMPGRTVVYTGEISEDGSSISGK